MSGSPKYGQFKPSLPLWCLIVLLLSAFPAFSRGTEEAGGIVELTEGWEYRWGDSPGDATGRKAWAIEATGSPGWYSMSLPNWAPDRQGNTYLWQRIQLPGGNWADPVIFFLGPFIYFQVYLEDALIYSHGDPDKPEEVQFIGDPWHIVHLPGGFEGKHLSFRIFSNYNLIGIPEKVLLGSHAAIYKRIITGDVDRLIIGFLCLFLGIFSVSLFFRHKTMKPYLYFGLFALTIGLYVIRYTWIKQFFIDIPMFWIYIWILTIFSIPIGILGFVRTIYGDGFKNSLRYMFRGHLMVAPVLIVLMYLFPEQTILFALVTIRVLYLVYMAALLPYIIHKAVRKEGEAQIFLVGFTILILFGIFDILVGLGLIPWLRPMSHIGMFLFTITLVIVLKRHLVSMYRNLQRLTAERQRIAGELHDGISGIMTNISLLTEVARKNDETDHKERALTTISSLSREGLSEIQSFMNSLDEEATNWPALAADFRLYGTNTLSPFGIEFTMNTDLGTSPLPPSSFLFLNLYRIYREGLTNIVKHSGATSVAVDLAVSKESLTLSIQDDGTGLPETVSGGRGLSNLKTRAGEIGGTVEINSNHGTSILVTVTYPKNTRYR